MIVWGIVLSVLGGTLVALALIVTGVDYLSTILTPAQGYVALCLSLLVPGLTLLFIKRKEL